MSKEKPAALGRFFRPYGKPDTMFWCWISPCLVGVGFKFWNSFRERTKAYQLVLSIYPEKQYARRSLELGAKGYLTKNSPPEELVAAIHKVARGEVYITPVVAEQLAKNLRRDTLSQPHKKLSQREFQVMRMLAQGKSPTQIAEELSLSPKTVSTYRRRILDKLGLSSTGEIIQYALSKGIVPT